MRAAIHGRVLILEGIEKAERNVLPVLNNLLENREMQLEDGSFLMAPKRYDALLVDHTREELDQLKFIRVDERFRIIALGLPVPPYVPNQNACDRESLTLSLASLSFSLVSLKNSPSHLLFCLSHPPIFISIHIFAELTCP